MAIQKFQVVGPASLQDDETGKDVERGGVVALDDSIKGRNIPALIEGGHIGPVDKAKPATKTE